MTKYHDAIRTGRILLGTPYEQMDCMALIREIIKRSAGGVPDYRCEGTNWLWKSIGNSGKYRHLTWQQDGIDGARAGMLAFKRNGDDVHHVGLVTCEGTVIHSSSVKGCVVETPLDSSWHCLGQHRYISVALKAIEPEEETKAEAPAADATDTNVGSKTTTLINTADGYTMQLSGAWRVAED